ncbi:hypothetical protein J4211_03510 [Candidatus Woesearchaeota archaeon]|nr:hypothetical protein [Candidatus Woesearchaeota archaeon]
MAKDPLPYAFFGLVGGAVLIMIGFKQWRIKRLVENTPTSKVRGIAMGFVEVCGTVSKPFKQYLVGPFTGKECVYYSYKIEEERQGSKGRRYWATIRSDVQSIPFFAKDNTGAVLVDPKGAIKLFSEKNNLRLSGLFGSRPLRFTETHLAPNDIIYILGTAGDNPYVKEGRAVNGVEDVMIQKGKHSPYYISDKGEKDVLKRFAWQVYGFLFSGCALLIACLAYILYRFGLF